MEDKLLDARIKALWLAARTMAFVIVAITCAMIVGLFVSNEIIDNKDVFGLLSYVMTSVVGAVAGSYATLMGMKGELVPPPPEDKDDPEPELEPTPVAPTPAPPPAPMAAPAAEVVEEAVQEELELDEPVDLDGDGVLQPWEIHAKDMRYDLNGDGVVDENDFPDWRSAGK
jgi:hypothetical protein